MLDSPSSLGVALLESSIVGLACCGGKVGRRVCKKDIGCSDWTVVYPHFRVEKYRTTTVRFSACVCVCFLPIHSGHQGRWTYQPGSHRISHPPSFCGACLNFSREKDSAIPFPLRPLSRILCTSDLIVLHPLGIFIFVF